MAEISAEIIVNFGVPSVIRNFIGNNWFYPFISQRILDRDILRIVLRFSVQGI